MMTERTIVTHQLRTGTGKFSGAFPATFVAFTMFLAGVFDGNQLLQPAGKHTILQISHRPENALLLGVMLPPQHLRLHQTLDHLFFTLHRDRFDGRPSHDEDFLFEFDLHDPLPIPRISIPGCSIVA